jgi:hypothetical protein
MIMPKAIAFTLLVFFAFSACAQRTMDEETGWSISDRGYAGVGLGGLNFGKSDYLGNYFSIGVSALGGFMLTKNLSTGIGFEYQYTTYPDKKLKNHLYGGYPFVRYNIKNFFLQFDYDLYSVQLDLTTTSEREMKERAFAGIGFSSSSNGRTFVNFLVSYDFLYTSSSIFSSPLNTRLFFTF